MPTKIPVPDLIGGVSQMPSEQRAPNQLTALDNGISTLAHGLRKRQPSEHVGIISDSTTGYDSAYVHPVNRSDTERYTVVVVDGDLKVFDTLTGIEQTVIFPNGKDYLTGSARGFRAFTVGDHTFLVNRGEVVRRGATRSAAVPHEALLFFRMADYATGYIVNIDSFQFAYTTALDATAAARVEIATDAVALGMLQSMRSHPQQQQFFAQFAVTQFGSTLYVKRIDGGDFVCTTRDGLSDKGLKLIKGRVQAMEDLPEKAKDGFVVEIIGNPGSPKDNTFVKYESTTEGLSDGEPIGVWRETTAPNLVVALDAATMPHELVRQGYLTTANVLMPPRQPVYTSQPNPTGTSYGFTTDGSDVSTGAASLPKVLDDDGEAARTPALTTGTHATQTRTLTFRFDIDTANVQRGTAIYLELWKNTGSGFVYSTRRAIPAGVVLKDAYLRFAEVIPSGTRYQLKLSCSPAPTSVFRKPRITLHGDGDEDVNGRPTPGVSIASNPSATLNLGVNTMYWPSGSSISATIDGTTFSYTLTADMLASDVAIAFAAVIDANAFFLASYVPPTSPSTATNIVITRANSVTPVVSAASTAFSSATKAWGFVTMTPNEHVGRIVRNMTDGSEGVIASNSVRAIGVFSLTGGKTNLFNPGDMYEIFDGSDAYFVFQQAPWTNRLVGNDDMSKWPSFVDRRISEVFFTANRLGFTAEDFVCLSASGDLYRFWRETVTQVLDSDPIDVQSAHKDVGFLDSAVQWEGTCLLCSSNGHQFSLAGDPVLSPTTVRLDHISSYPVTAKSRPIVLGSSVFFPRKSNGYAQVREMYRTRDGVDAALITGVVPRYIPGDVLDMAGDPDHGFVAVLPDGGSRNAVFLYTYATVGEGKQTAWQRWTFDGTVIGIDSFDGFLYLVLYRYGQVRLERINIGNPMDDSGDYRDVGDTAYTMTATLSRLHVRDKNGDPVSSGRLQIRTVAPQVSSGYVRTSVEATNKPTKSYVWSTRQKRHPVLAENTAATITLVNDQSTGCTITGLEYEVTYSDRS